MARLPASSNRYPVSPPWPPPKDLAPSVSIPSMSDRESFVKEMVKRYGDEASSAEQRWNAAVDLLVGGEMNGCDEKERTEASSPASRVLAAWLLTPREAFLPEQLRHDAYLYRALPIGQGQTISAPYMVSRMTAALNPHPGKRVLEIGTGSGYQTAMMAVLTDHVQTIEYVPSLAADAARKLESLAKSRPWLSSIRSRSGNGYMGWEEGAPYNGIIVTCAIDHPPPALLNQLAFGGKLILPLGSPRAQRLVVIRRTGSGETPAEPQHGLPSGYQAENVYHDGTQVVFVPFVH